MASSAIERSEAIEDGEVLLTPRELAAWFRLRTAHSVYVAIREGRLRAVRLGEKGSLRIRKADALAWLRPVENA